MNKKSDLVLRNESGAALVVALLMIVVLSLIGLASSSSSNFEIRLSGNKRAATNAFYSADSGAISVTADLLNFSTTGWQSISQGTFDNNAFLKTRQELKTEFNTTLLMTSAAPNFSLPAGVSFTDTPSITRMHLDRGSPRGVGSSALSFVYEYYIIDSVGRDQMDFGTVKSNCEIREKIVRLEPTGQ
jgi:Tfp pilus assembly protein PilX